MYSSHNNGEFYVTGNVVLIRELQKFRCIHDKTLKDPKTHITFTDMEVKVKKEL